MEALQELAQRRSQQSDEPLQDLELKVDECAKVCILVYVFAVVVSFVIIFSYL